MTKIIKIKQCQAKICRSFDFEKAQEIPDTIMNKKQVLCTQSICSFLEIPFSKIMNK